MNRYLYLTVGLLLIPMGTAAYTSCVGGTEITANAYDDIGAPAECTTAMCPKPARTFCKSNIPMNWWSAFNWCRSNGGTLASLAEACPGVATRNDEKCPALKGVSSSQTVWTSIGLGTEKAFRIGILDGKINANGNRSGSTIYALCR